MSAKLECLKLRAAAARALRETFSGWAFTEVETPLRVAAPALEDHIDALPSGSRWLRTSPELHMKRLLAAGAERIFQLGPCFRAGEHGRRHREEFTMLEWYQAGIDYVVLREQTQALVLAVAKALEAGGWLRDDLPALAGTWELLTVDEAFRRYAGCPVAQALADDAFDLLLVERVEPRLGQDAPTFLTDYPAELAALARCKAENPAVAERWELYLRGLELANAFSELTDPAEQRRRFLATADYRREQGRELYPLDEAFLQALPQMPPAAGCALGFDRLLMALTGRQEIADVRLFEG